MKKVFVGLSGGVDSAVSAALLKERGHDVTGVFIKIWQPEFIECSWREDRLDAMRVCAALSIPYREIDLSEEYKKGVVEYMVASYERGETPNPDVLCNREIKFGSFMRWALGEGAERVATGHYARSEMGSLVRGIDTSKDQSYFLYTLTKSQLEKIIFPIGDMQKSDVRQRADALQLPVAHKPDSQGLCFVGGISLPEFLGHYTTLTEGSVLNDAGETIGTHDGAARFTLGQRHGFSLVSAAEAPRYVSATDVTKNTITVSTDKTRGAVSRARVAKMHWIDEAPELPHEYDVQTRYRETPLRARLISGASGLVAEFIEPHLISGGQSLVVYDGEKCLGGGEIASSSQHAPAR